MKLFCWHDWLIHRTMKGEPASVAPDAFDIEAHKWVTNRIIGLLLGAISFVAAGIFIHPILLAGLGITVLPTIVMFIFFYVERGACLFFDRTCRKCEKLELTATKLEEAGGIYKRKRDAQEAELTAKYLRDKELWRKAQ